MYNTDIGCGKSIQNVSDDFGRGHLLYFILYVGKVHQFKTLDVIILVKLFLRLMKSADHEHVDFIILVDSVFSLLDSFD